MNPTAVQAVVDGHDTRVSVVDMPLGFGVVWIDQLVPFHRSANVALSLMDPTAVHAVVVVHDTPLRKPEFCPARVGVDWTVQLVPFHRSANGT